MKVLFCLLTILMADSMANFGKSNIYLYPVRFGENHWKTSENDKKYKISETKGFLIAKFKSNLNKGFEIFNADSTLWMKYKVGKSKYVNPFALSGDNYLLVFRCLDTNQGWYKIVVDEKKNVIKYLKKSDNEFIFQTWEQHILGLFSISFDVTKNYPRKSPSMAAQPVEFQEDEFFHPSRINKEWLQVKWQDGKNWKFGWIKWKEKDKLIIELFYFA